MVGDQRGLSFATSLRLGVGRLTAELVTSDPPRGGTWRVSRSGSRDELEPVLGEVRELKPRMLVGSSGTSPTSRAWRSRSAAAASRRRSIS